LDPAFGSFKVVLLSAFVNAPTSSILTANLIILLLIFLSGLMSASEIAFFSLTNAEVSNLRESEDRIDNRIARLLERPRYLLSTILITNNLSNIGVVLTSYYVTRRMLHFTDLQVGSFIIPDPVLEFLWNLVLVTILLVLFAEATPKVYATHHKMKIARAMNGLVSAMVKVYYPLNYVLVNSTLFIERRLKKYNAEINIDEINKAIEITVEKKESKQDAKLLKGIVHFGNITVKQIMRPRTAVAALHYEFDFTEVRDFVRNNGYSRYPVYKDSPDNVVGILSIKDLLEHQNQGAGFGWQSLSREPFFVPEGKKIDDLLREIQQNRKHMAVVVDEFGGTSGIITLEDIVEEVVGDITDEFDDAADGEFKKLDERNYLFDGKTSLVDVGRLMEADTGTFNEARGEAESLGGLVLELAGRIPKNGDELRFPPYKFTIVSVMNNRVEKVRITNEA
jgi:putative hemolysin